MAAQSSAVAGWSRSGGAYVQNVIAKPSRSCGPGGSSPLGGDDRRAPGDQVAGGGHLLAQPVDPGRHQPGRPRRHPRHDRRGPQVDAQGEQVVQHHGVVHAQAV